MMIAYHLRDCRERRCGRAETGAAARDEHERVLQVRITGVLMRADFCPTLVARVYLSYKSRLPDRDLKERNYRFPWLQAGSGAITSCAAPVSISSTCCRPIETAIWISSWVPAARWSSASRIDEHCCLD